MHVPSHRFCVIFVARSRAVLWIIFAMIFGAILASFRDPKVDHFEGILGHRKKEGDPDRGELKERSGRDQAAARNPSPLAKGLKGIKRIKGLKEQRTEQVL